MLVFYLCHILSSPLSLPFWPHIWKSSGSLDAPFFGAGGKFPGHMRILTLGLYSNSNKNPKPVSVCVLSVHFGLTSELPYYLQKALHFFFSSARAACGITGPWPETEPEASAVEAWSPYHWTITEFARKLHYVSNKIFLYPLGVYAVISLEVWSHSEQGGMGPFYLFLVSTYSYLVAQ